MSDTADTKNRMVALSSFLSKVFESFEELESS